jgi:hypothetical protein
MRNRIILFGVISALLPLTEAVKGQIIYGRPASGDIQLIYSHWSVKSDSGTAEIDQWTFPVSGFVPIKDNFEARFYAARVSNSLEFLGTGSKLSGLGDVRILVNHTFYDDRLLLGAGINLPVGKKELNMTAERTIVEVLSENYLSFPLRRLGEGYGLNLLLGAASMVGEVRLGAGFVYQYIGSYDPYEGIEEYDPGDFISANASADLNTRNAIFGVDIIYTRYSTDRQNGTDIFRQSPQFEVRAGSTFGSQGFSFSIDARYLVRGRHTRYDSETGDIISRLKLYGNEFTVKAQMDYRSDSWWQVTPALDLKLIAADEADTGGASVFGPGLTIGRQITDDFQMSAGAKYFIGSADGGNIDLNGVQITAALSVIL